MPENFVTFNFEISPDDDRETFVHTIRELKSFWKENGFSVALYQDLSHQMRFLLTFTTKKTIDALTDLIQNHPGARKLFEQMKSEGGKIGVSVMEQKV